MGCVLFIEEVLLGSWYRDKWEEKMNILEIIEKKRNNQELTQQEIKYFIEKYTNEEIPDYQAAALVMAI